jgi:hypothetical protein
MQDARYKSGHYDALLRRYAYLLSCPSGERGWILLRWGALGHRFVKRGGWAAHAGEALVIPRGRQARLICQADPNMYAIPTNVFRCTKCWEQVPWDFGCCLSNPVEDEWCDNCWAEWHEDDEDEAA